MAILYYPTEKGSTSAEEIRDQMEDIIWRQIVGKISFNEIEAYYITVNVENVQESRSDEDPHLILKLIAKHKGE